MAGKSTTKRHIILEHTKNQMLSLLLDFTYFLLQNKFIKTVNHDNLIYGPSNKTALGTVYGILSIHCTLFQTV